MNPIEKELKNYIDNAEQFSGFDDNYDSYEGEMSGFDEFDTSALYFDDYSNAAGGAAPTKVSEPITLQYVNSTTNDVTAILFGFNDYATATNYGNPAAVTITNLNGGTYGRAINQTSANGMKVGKWRLQSATSSQLQVTLSINFVQANGNTLTKPLNLSIQKDAYQFQSDTLDINYPVTIDGNTYITFTLKASATLTISMYPINSISTKSLLNGGSDVMRAKAPRLSGKNAAPVIIQTSQPVRGIKG
jgi:hypothetical protein